MPRNVEIKARLSDPLAARRRAREVADEGPWQIAQHDTFFRCATGRLKLRRFADGSGELIAYDRADERGPKTSHYRIVPTADPGALAAVLGEALGVLGEVRKVRTLWLAGRTRIHLDEVELLGSFLELEVVLERDDAAAAGERRAAQLMAALGVGAEDLVAGAYIDLLLESEGEIPER
jgi:adenylate cyclase